MDPRIRTLDDPLLAVGGLPRSIVQMLPAGSRARSLVLRGTALFEEDLPQPRRCQSLRQFERLLQNFHRQRPQPETPFQWGAQLHRSTPAPASLPELLATGTERFPLVSTDLQRHGDGRMSLHLNASAQLHLSRPLIEAALVLHRKALEGLAAATAIELQAFEYFLPYPEPDHLEQYLVHLPGRRHFDAPFTAICFGARQRRPELFEVPLEETGWLAPPGDLREADGTAVELLLPTLRRLIRQRPNAASLGDAAARCGISNATLKRRLADHGVRFQELLDQTRCELATSALLLAEVPVDELGRHLQLGADPSNFRRAFKRWTGLTPRMLKDRLAGT